jgi:hypothetical protein
VNSHPIPDYAQESRRDADGKVVIEYSDDRICCMTDEIAILLVEGSALTVDVLLQCFRG